ncbi:MAG: hypothetical protein WA734_20695 [Candidatus Acidiferrales bacterium]
MSVQAKAEECPAEEVTEKANRSHSEERSNEESLIFLRAFKPRGILRFDLDDGVYVFFPQPLKLGAAIAGSQLL